MQLNDIFQRYTKPAAVRVIPVFLVALLANGCSSNPTAPASASVLTNQLPQPTKDILISYGRYDKPYETLGAVEYTLKNASIPDDQIELWDQAIDFLKQEALARYGDKVDAIVDVEIVDSAEVKNGDNLDIIHAQGVAIAFNSGIKPTTKQKVKYRVKYKSKSSKPKSNRIKASKKVPGKTKVEEIQFSPSELLK